MKSLTLPEDNRPFLGTMNREKTDVIVIGGGIIGLAVAYQIQENCSGTRVVVLEKEDEVAVHQTGHNSGVLHSGVYYRPGSLKALNCRQGKSAMELFCREHGIDFEICGKVIVAVSDSELSRMHEIFRRGQANGVECEIIGMDRLQELEPHVAGVGAIHVPETGIVDFRKVCWKLREIVSKDSGEIVTGTEVINLHDEARQVLVETTGRTYQADMVVNCAGLYSDKVADMTHGRNCRIIPFRGEYYQLKPVARHLCRNLIYPVPDPNFPFLGVHFTRMINGTVECGPNAVLALAREGYQKSDFNLTELWDTLAYPAFWKMTMKYWRTGAGEIWRSLYKGAFVKALQRLVPEIHASDLDVAPAGIRAQALLPDGVLVDDFLIQESARVVHVCNAPSPAATASLNIAKIVVKALQII